MSVGDGLHDQVTQTRVSGSTSFKQHSPSLYSTVAAMAEPWVYDLGCDWGAWGRGGLGAAWFGSRFYVFNQLF